VTAGRWVAAAALLALAGALPAAGEGEIITVHNLSNADRVAEPVRLGVPLPPGETAAHVVDASGKAGPAWVYPLAAGSERRAGWAWLVFLATVKANERAQYRLEWGRTDVVPPMLPHVTETDDQLIVTTGPAQFAFARTRLTGLEGAWLDLNGDGKFTEGERLIGSAGGPYVVDSRGTRYTGTDARHVTVWVGGYPLRMTLFISGFLGSKEGAFTRADFRFTMYAGKPYLDISYTMTLAHLPETTLPELRYELPPIRAERDVTGLSFLRYRLSRQAWREITDWGVRFPVPLSHPRRFLGGYGPVDRPANLVQYADDEYVVHRGPGSDSDDEIGRGGQAPGWAEMRGDGAGVVIAVRDFWQAFPKRLRLTEDAIEVGLWPDAVPPLSAPLGLAMTHEMRLFLHGGEADSESEALAFQSPLIATLPAERYCAAGVLRAGAVPTAAQSGCPVGETKLAAQADSIVRLRDDRRMYGLTDYGDLGYTNNSRDALEDFVLQFARTADPRLLVFAGPLARHYADVDIRHDHSEPRLIGGGLLPDKEDYQIYTSPHTALCVSPSYSYPQGLADYALITGDSRLFQVAEGLGTYFLAAMDADGGYHVQARPDAQQWLADSGAALVGLCDLYELTGVAGYLEAARKAAAYLVRTQNADGSWYAQSPGRLDIEAGFARTDDPSRTNIFSDTGGLPQSVVLEGLAALQRIAPEAAVRDAFIKGVGFMLNHGRLPERDGFVNSTWRGNPLRFAETHLAWYQNEPAYSVECSARMLEALARAYEVTGETTYMKEAVRVYSRLLAAGPAKVGSVYPWQETLEKVDIGPAKHFPAFFAALKQLGWPEPLPTSP